MSEKISSKRINDIIIPLVKEVGALQCSYLDKDLEIEYKGDINLVTQVDKKSEEMIVTCIQNHFPEHDIMAEEGSGGERKDSPYKWIIDPLDGTTNFAHRYPLFAVSIGLEYQGEILAGIVYDPNKDEVFRSYAGEGAFLNNKKIKVSAVDDMERAMLATGFAYNIRETPKNNLNHFSEMLMHSQAVRRDGVAAIDLCYVACGRYDGFWELNLFPWDTAAGILMITEAGGRVSRFAGESYTCYEKDILVSNGSIHDQMISHLKKGL